MYYYYVVIRVHHYTSSHDYIVANLQQFEIPFTMLINVYSFGSLYFMLQSTQAYRIPRVDFINSPG